MSQVEPSPPQTTTVVSPWPRSRSAALIPDASAAAEANGVRWTETPNALTGQTPAMIVQHEAGITRTIFDSGARCGQAVEHVPDVDRGPAAGAGGVAGKQELLLGDDLVEPDGHLATPSGTYTGPAFGAPRRPRLVRAPSAACRESRRRRPRPQMKFDGGLHVPEVERPHVAAERPERAEGGRAVDHGDVGDARESGRELRRRERPVGVDADDEQVVVVVERAPARCRRSSRSRRAPCPRRDCRRSRARRPSRARSAT